MSERETIDYAFAYVWSPGSLEEALALLAQKVNCMIRQGWQPCDPIIKKQYASGNVEYAQKMVKYKDKQAGIWKNT